MGVGTKIWLADLTYAQQTISPDVMPRRRGGASLPMRRSISVPRQRFESSSSPKSWPTHLSAKPPHVIGFFNYMCWNEDLSTQFARVIKMRRPQVITVFGGPNCTPSTQPNRKRFCASIR